MSTRRSGRRVSLLVIAVVGVIWLSSSGLSASPEKKEKEDYALVAGTVFTAEGFSLPGVKVTIKRKGDDKAEWERVSDRRGEFAVRVPSTPATYEVSTHSEERENQTKSVKIEGEERANVFFRLPLKKPEKEEED